MYGCTHNLSPSQQNEIDQDVLFFHTNKSLKINVDQPRASCVPCSCQQADFTPYDLPELQASKLHWSSSSPTAILEIRPLRWAKALRVDLIV